ncbi:MAG: PKD domain-containing protein [Proteobacteria bacterium]|nr:PKD domain-containing protein [Pseudomonadota bacterium]
MRSREISFATFAVIASFTLTGCGGSGSSSGTNGSSTNSGGGTTSSGGQPANSPPTALLTLDRTSGNTPLTVAANATGSTDSDGTIASTTIDFGDGSAAFSGSSTTHVYSAAGTFIVKVTVTDNGGLTGSTTKAVTVASVPGQPSNQAPEAKLTLNPTSGFAALSVAADASASSDPDGTVASTKIDFGDGTTAATPTATHVFSAPGTYTVTATVTDNSGLTASKTTDVVVVAPGSGFTTHGFTIPVSHPRLWWTPTRIASARTWLTAHPFTPRSGNYPDMAFKHVVSGSDCTAAVNWAAAWAPSADQVTTSAAGSDDMRGEGESVLLVYDWCYDQFTPTQKTTFISHWNTWVGNVQQQEWGGNYGGTWMSQNNYFWGNLRNELEWGIISYGDNGSGNASRADNFIDYALNTRWKMGFLPTTLPGGAAAGGVPLEGESYGAAVGAYMLIPAASVANMGRDLWDETAFFKSMMYWMLYWTTPSSTVVKDAGGISTFHVSTVNEEDKMSGGGILWIRNYFEDWMDYFAQHAAAHYSGTPMAGYTRKWLGQLNPVAPLDLDPNATGSSNYYVSNYIISNDPGSAPTAYNTLPLDYYASGSGYGAAKTAWDTTSTQLTYFFNTPMTSIVGHSHEDWGSFNLWRGGRWVMRETAGYSDTIVGTPGIASNAGQDSGSPFAHNVPVFTNVALGLDSNPTYVLPTVYAAAPSVKRLESNPKYFYADVDLTGAYKWDSGHSGYNTGVVGHVERELLYIRSLETTVVLDRITTQNQTHPSAQHTAAAVVTSFLTHYETAPTIEDPSHFTAINGTQALRQTVLLPLSPMHRVINEGGAVGQFRVEVDASGAAQRYQLHVLQARDASGSNIQATLVDSNQSDPATGTFTVTLHPSAGSDTILVFNKGQGSSGGTISVAGGSAVNLRTTVQPVIYNDNGIVWQ